MVDAPRSATRFAPPVMDVSPLPGGGLLLSSPTRLGPYPDRVGEHLRRWAREAPDRPYLAEREPGGGWRKVTYAQALGIVESVGQALLDRGLNAETPAMFLSDNSVDYGLLVLGCMHVGIPVAPVSSAYSLVSQDHAKLRYVFDLVQPKMIFASEGAPFAKALSSLKLDGVEVVVSSNPIGGRPSTLFSSLASTRPTAAVEAAFQRVGPDTIAKILFTSGSTGMPKGVINTHRMICSNQQSIAQIWPFVEHRPPVFVDWLPWNHTFGGNKTFNLVLRNGGTLYIDSGKAAPGHIERSVANLREISPTIYWNVPRGYDMLLPYLESDRELRESFFRELDLLFYAAAALPQQAWNRLEKLSLETRGELVPMASGWGSTETSPSITMVHYPITQAGIIGIPMPGIEVKMVPNSGKMELRVRGPNVTPGYYKEAELTEKAFDEDGFFRMGDAGKFVDPEAPCKGLVFDGRVTEDFKLTTGTWVHVGGLRVGALDAAAPYVQDAVVTGHDRDYLGLLIWPNPAECRKLAPDCGSDPAALCRAPQVVEAIRECLRKRNAEQKGSSTRLERVLLMAEPPSLDANEITDKGYINQRAALERRAALVERLYRDPPAEDVIVL